VSYVYTKYEAYLFKTKATFGIQVKLLICQTVVLPFFFRSSTVTVKVTLEDINDHVPIFDEQFYTETATEVAAVNSTILTVKVRVTEKTLNAC